VTPAVGIDVGGTKCLGVLLAADGSVIERHRRPTPATTEELVGVIGDLASELRVAASDAVPVGVGIAGLVTLQGVVRSSPNLGSVRELPLADILRRRFDVVTVDNDATCAAVAEWRVGAARGFDDVVVVTLGTGIGGGFVVDGRIRRGANGFAGEIGHMVVDVGGRSCPCGRRGCWERYASGTALGEVDPGRTSQVLIEDARAGDRSAAEAIRSWAGWVGLGLANLTNLVDPAGFVIAGGLAEASDVLLEPIRSTFREALYAPEHRPVPTVEMAGLGAEAGAIGAAIMAADATRRT
jgi:glucokinase